MLPEDEQPHYQVKDVNLIGSLFWMHLDLEEYTFFFSFFFWHQCSPYKVVQKFDLGVSWFSHWQQRVYLKITWASSRSIVSCFFGLLALKKLKDFVGNANFNANYVNIGLVLGVFACKSFKVWTLEVKGLEEITWIPPIKNEVKLFIYDFTAKAKSEPCFILHVNCILIWSTHRSM